MIETDPQMIQILKLLDMTLKEEHLCVQENRWKIQNITKELEAMKEKKGNKMKNLKMKNTTTEIN